MTTNNKVHLALAIVVVMGLFALWIAEPNDLEKAQAIYENAEEQVKIYEQQVKEAQALLDEALSFKVKAEALVMALGGRMVDKTTLDEILTVNFSKSGKSGIESFLQVNGAEFVKDKAEIFRQVGEHYKIKPEVLVAIAMADSSLGQALKTKNNLGNIGNNDRGDTVSYATLEAGIEAMGKTLTNQYLGNHTKIGELSNGGRTVLKLKACGVDGVKCYATSKSNWNRNVVGALREMFQDQTIDESFNFRI
jgi:hypothetical protein